MAIDTPVWISYGACPGFQSQSESRHWHVLSPARNGFVRFTSGATPTDLLAASMTAELFWGLEAGIKHAIRVFP